MAFERGGVAFDGRGVAFEIGGVAFEGGVLGRSLGLGGTNLSDEGYANETKNRGTYGKLNHYYVVRNFSELIANVQFHEIYS